ncbi:hypothetical protein [Flavobacterium psychraquaticum]|uniref:hypothetical protein n=1 Tax=Flavobacterium psychraquaticum TaxID=3103958 RepID=UPI002ACE2EDC|nr:hypothetical protein [Flavobacterium sp. LB-N7T]
MKNSLILGLIITFTITTIGCKKSNSDRSSIVVNDSIPDNDAAADSYRMKPSNFIPDDCALYEQITGDLNKDGLEDYVLIIKGTDKEKILIEENSINLNRNRRGIIILFKKEEGYELILRNLDCFSSENEEGSAYFDPELTVSIKNGNLEIKFGHGKHGFWNYTFQHKNDDFEMIGYFMSASNGTTIKSETTINYLTQKKLIKTNTNNNKKAGFGEEIFKEKEENIVIKKIIKLSDIKDFDEFSAPE